MTTRSGRSPCPDPVDESSCPAQPTLNPAHPSVHLERTSEWQAAIAVDPSHFAYAGPTLVRVGKARVKQERWSDAIDAAQEAINVGYEGAMQDARLLMAEANLGNDSFDDAVRWYRQAVEANQEDQRAKDGLRRAEVALKQSKVRHVPPSLHPSPAEGEEA